MVKQSQITAIVVVCLLGIAVPLLSLAAPNETLVQVLPAEGSYAVQEEIEVEVWVTDVVDLYAADIKLTFDVARLAVIDANPVMPGIQITLHNDLLSPDWIVHRDADNLSGTVWYVVTQMNPRQPASGSGRLFSFRFKPLSHGQSTISIQQELVTRHADPIQATTQGAEYAIEGPYARFLPMIIASH